MFRRTPFSIPNHQTPDHPRYEAALLPPDLDTGTPYEMSDPASAKTLMNKFAKPDIMKILVKNPGEETTHVLEKYFGYFDFDVSSPREEATVDEATRKLETFLDPGMCWTFPEVRAAHTRLKRLDVIHAYNDWGPDVVYKAFEDINLVFFGGMLRNRVRIFWRTVDDMGAQKPNTPADKSHVPGMCVEWQRPLNFQAPGEDKVTRLGYGKMALVSLNAKLILLEPTEGNTKWDNMWGVLLHELVHAYLHTRTGYRAPTFLPSDTDKSHGECFERCVRAIHRQCQELSSLSTVMNVEMKFYDERERESKLKSVVVNEPIE